MIRREDVATWTVDGQPSAGRLPRGIGRSAHPSAQTPSNQV